MKNRLAKHDDSEEDKSKEKTCWIERKAELLSSLFNDGINEKEIKSKIKTTSDDCIFCHFISFENDEEIKTSKLKCNKHEKKPWLRDEDALDVNARSFL